VIVVEILDRSGAPRERVRVPALPATIGRAYDNDVIVDDRYVSPRHARILLAENGDVVVEDAGSTNGLFVAASRERVERLTCDRETAFRVGHTLLRIRRPDDPVPPALVEREPAVRTDSWTVSIAAFLGAAGLVILNHVLNSFERIQATQIAFGLCIAGLLILAWASGWALASRIVVHQARLREHMTVATLSTIAMMIADKALELGTFSLGLDDWTEWVVYVPFLVIFTFNLYGHLGLCTQSGPRRRARTAAMVAAVFVGFVAFSAEIADDEFSVAPTPNASLKPPFFRLVGALSAEAFVLEARSLKEEVDGWAKEP